jgi:hypothetical protein
MKKHIEQFLSTELCMVFGAAIGAILVSLFCGIPVVLSLKSAGFVYALFLSRHIPYEHPYGYKGDWYGWKDGMIK